METSRQPYWIEIIQNAILERKAKNPSYSLRAFSRDLSISPAVLSRILAGKRKLTPEVACRIGLSLHLSDHAFKELIRSVFIN